jgi:hypothetical protein
MQEEHGGLAFADHSVEDPHTVGGAHDAFSVAKDVQHT